MNRPFRFVAAAVALLGVATAAQAAPVTVYSNNPSGDYYTLSGTFFIPIGSSGWYYVGDADTNFVIGINGSYPYNGNGSVFINLPNESTYGGVYYWLPSPQSLSSLQSITYSWYRDSTSTNPGNQAPAFAVLIGNGFFIFDFLIFERVYQPSTPGNVPTNTWVTENIGSETYLWNGTDLNGNGNPYDEPLSAWKLHYPGWSVYAFYIFGGSGWNGNFKGAVDNPSWQFGADGPVVGPFNFEMPVPEPASLAALGLALAGAACVYRRRPRKA